MALAYATSARLSPVLPKRHKNRTPAVRMALAAGRALLVALVVGQLGLALLTSVRDQVSNLEDRLAGAAVATAESSDR